MFEVRPYEGATKANQNELQDAAITLVARGRMPDSLPQNADVAMHLIVKEGRDPARLTVRSLRPVLTPAGYLGDTISIPWRARPGDRVTVRVVVDASGHDLSFRHGDEVAVTTQLLFEGLLNGVTVQPVRAAPTVPRSPELPIKSLYR